MLKELVKTGNLVYFLVNCSVQLVARNREDLKGLNNVPCVIWSCYDIMNYASRLIIRATSCTLLHRELRIEVNKRPQKADNHIKMTALFCIMVKSAVRFSDVFYCVRYRRLQ